MRRQASPRVLAAAGGVAAVVVIAIVLAIVLTGGSSKTQPLTGTRAINALFQGVPQRGTTLGSPKAPVTMTEFIDLQCPGCDAFELQVFPDVVRRFVRPGKLRVVMEPLAFIGPDSVRGRGALLAIARQNRAFNFAQLLYDNQGTENTGWLNDTMIKRAAASIPGVRVQSVLTERNAVSIDAEGTRIDTLGQTRGVQSTPTFFVGKSGTPGAEVPIRGPIDEATLVTAITAALSS